MLSLLLGILVYLIDRPPGSVYFLPGNISLFQGMPTMFGIVGNSLPTFSHVFSFILITAGLLGSNKTCSAITCIGWFLVDFAFELGQHQVINRWLADRIPEWFEWLPILENTQFYFLGGTFDPCDLLSITLGTIVAYFAIIMTTKRDSS